MTAATDDFDELLERVVSDVIRKEAPSVDRNGGFPRKSIRALADAGLLVVVSAPEVGGRGLGFRGGAGVVERVAQECGSTAMVVCMHFAGCAVLEALAPVEVRRAAASGRHLSTLALSEDGSRSHFWAPVGSAVSDGQDALLSADKSFVTSASQATAYVWSSRPLGGEGLSTLWLVPAGSEGISVKGPFDGLGLRGNDSAPVAARNVRVPLSAMLGPDGGGFDIMLQLVLPMFSVCNAAFSVGLMQAAVRKVSDHASGARFAHLDAALSDFPTVRAYIARMKIRADAAGALLGDTLAALEGERDDATLRILEVKAYAGESATEVLDLAMRVSGGAAFRKEIGVERIFRDARAATVMGPTTDVLYDFIGKAVCGMELFA
jgi:alkylation response protein AidB-like acyl-CoA dehydrogenase